MDEPILPPTAPARTRAIRGLVISAIVLFVLGIAVIGWTLLRSKPEEAVPPALAPAPQGTPCGMQGRCTAQGVCQENLAEGCPEFAEATLCSAGLDPARGRYCAVAATGNCAAVCTGFRRACVAAYEASPVDACVAGAQVGCLEARPALVCACTQSPL